jgi:hypothetical protein
MREDKIMSELRQCPNKDCPDKECSHNGIHKPGDDCTGCNWPCLKYGQEPCEHEPKLNKRLKELQYDAKFYHESENENGEKY